MTGNVRPEAAPLAASQVKPGAMVMARAICDDPFFTFALPDAVRRARLLQWLFEKTIHYGQRYGKVYTTPALDGIAIWLGPQETTPTLQGALRTGLFLFPLKLSVRELERCMRLSDCADRLHEQSVSGRHWYLHGLGVEPSRQGQGIGGALLQPLLAQAGQDALVCYLDTTNEKNVPFYERNGFAVAGHGQAKRGGPHVWGMVREPKSPGVDDGAGAIAVKSHAILFKPPFGG